MTHGDPHKKMGEHILATFIRTKTVFKNRLKDLKNYDKVKVYVYELEKLGCNHGPLLWRLKQQGEIWYDSKGNFKSLRNGPVDPSLLDMTKKAKKIVVPLTALHIWMREQLSFVNICGVKRVDIPVYFKAFLDHRKKDLTTFFSVDSFSGRVHTPVVNLKGDLRFSLRFHGEKIVSLDVKQMQPTILAKVLLDSIGSNCFSDSIFKGEDVYVLLQKSAKLSTRADAKKYLFKLIFGKPMDDIGKFFEGDQRVWVDWINSYKSRVEPKNPHRDKPHTNLAWLLQFSEVKIMTEIWQKLMESNIPFLTIHDELLCRKSDEHAAYTIMEERLKDHFSFFKIMVDH